MKLPNPLPRRKSKKEPAVIYHYTSMATLLKILQTRCVWATNVRYLNDTSERKHFYELLAELLPDYLIKNSKHKKIFNEIVKRNNGPLLWYPFVSSFSTNPDSLSQWRAYCRAGNGVAIGFRTSLLKNAQIADHNNMIIPTTDCPCRIRLRKVEYLGLKQRSQVDTILGLAISRAEEEIRRNRKLAGSTRGWLHDELEDLATQTKDPSFSAEEEYRLVAKLGGNRTERFVQYRATQSTLVPYISLFLPDSDKPRVKYPSGDSSRALANGRECKPPEEGHLHNFVRGSCSVFEDLSEI